jgi:hypothetical protein
VARRHVSKSVNSNFHIRYMKLYLLLFKARHLSEQNLTSAHTFPTSCAT